jgi:hypothetical protein
MAISATQSLGKVPPAVSGSVPSNEFIGPQENDSGSQSRLDEPRIRRPQTSPKGLPREALGNSVATYLRAFSAEDWEIVDQIHQRAGGMTWLRYKSLKGKNAPAPI